MRRIAAVLLAAVLLCGCAGPAAPSTSEAVTVGGSTKRAAIESAERQFAPLGADEVTVHMRTTKGDIRFVLYPDAAPLAVENFCTLAGWGYYDGVAFHRVVGELAIQAGDATGSGRKGTSIWQGRPFHTEAVYALRHYSGALCMAAADGQRDTHLSQFYVVATPQNALDEQALAALAAAGLPQSVVETYRQAGGAPGLDGVDTVFGQVIEGMDVVDTIAKGAVEEGTTLPKNPVMIERVTVDNYPPAWMAVPPSQRAPLPPPDVPASVPPADAPQDQSGEDQQDASA